MDFLEAYPELSMELEQLCQMRRNKILQDMVENDDKYDTLCRARTKASMLLKDALTDNTLLDEYSNAVYAQECYELDALYRQGFIDALKVLMERGLL